MIYSDWEETDRVRETEDSLGKSPVPLILLLERTCFPQNFCVLPWAREIWRRGRGKVLREPKTGSACKDLVQKDQNKFRGERGEIDWRRD